MGESRKKVGRAQTPAVQNVRQEVEATKDFVAHYQDRVLKLMGRDEARVERFMQTFAQALAMEPKLARCTRASVIGGVLEIATLGLEPGVLGQAWMIPFKNKGRLEAVVVIGYRGFLELARRSGQVGPVEHAVVYEKDHFEWMKGTESYLRYKQADEDDRGRFVAAWAQATIRGFAKPQYEVMLAREINGIQARAPSAKAATSPWKSDPDAMRAKTVIRRLAKFLPMSAEMQRAVSIDEILDAGRSQNLASRAADIGELPIIDVSAIDDVDEPEVPGSDGGEATQEQGDGQGQTGEAPA